MRRPPRKTPEYLAHLKRILVVGGGAGGLGLVRALGKGIGKKGAARPILMDQFSTHIWKPLLHEVATGALNTGEDELNYFAHAHQSNYEFKLGKMIGLDRTKKTVRMASVVNQEGTTIIPERDIQYDTLVLAVGAVTNSFGTPGVEKCFQLNNHLQADDLRKKILNGALSVCMGTSKVPKLRIGIVGGGATGVELACEIYFTVRELHNCGSAIEKGQLDIRILEGAPRILGNCPEFVSGYAMKELDKRGIKVLLKTGVKEINDDGFVLKDGSLVESDIKIWTAGVKAPDWLAKLGLTTNRVNQIQTHVGTLQCVDDPNIYCIGDCAVAPDSRNEGKPCPASAQVAHQEAEWLVKKIESMYIKGVREPAPFVYKNQGMIVSLGTYTAVGNLVGIGKRQHYVSGFGAKWIYSALYRMHQASLYGWPRTTLVWTADRLRFIALPRVKLH